MLSYHLEGPLWLVKWCIFHSASKCENHEWSDLTSHLLYGRRPFQGPQGSCAVSRRPLFVCQVADRKLLFLVLKKPFQVEEQGDHFSLRSSSSEGGPGPCSRLSSGA